MFNYLVVLFKNKKKKKIINKFITLEKAKKFFDKKLKESEEIVFDVRVESGNPCQYELGLIELSSKQDSPIYLTDELGRNIRVKLDEPNMTLISIFPYKKEEKIFDIQTKKKISLNTFLKNYLRGNGLKMISTLNNKIILQEDEKIFLFSLKTENESARFVDSVSNYFYTIKRGDCMFVKDFSSPQRKYLYELLESNGIDKKILYRKFTTLPRQE